MFFLSGFDYYMYTTTANQNLIMLKNCFCLAEICLKGVCLNKVLLYVQVAILNNNIYIDVHVRTYL